LNILLVYITLMIVSAYNGVLISGFISLRQ